MSVRLRESLSALPAYVPGRAVPGAVKLASNESAEGPLPHVIDRIAATAAHANRYPDSSAVELTEALAARFGVRAGQIVVGCGSVALCQQLVLAAAGPAEEVLFGWRSFEAYPIVTAIGGAIPVMVPLAAATLDVAAMADAVSERTRLVFLCNPNNPTGTAVAGSRVISMLERIDPSVLVVLDEAYREFVTDPDVIDGTTLLGRFPNVIVLRTFSKAYGLAGLRIGYGIAGEPAVASAARQTQVQFAISQVAQAAALASLEPAAEEQLQGRVRDVVAERVRVSAALRELGYAVPETQANFVWLARGVAADGGIDPVAFGAGCDAHGVTVRVFPADGARVTVGSRADNDAFLLAAKALRG
jgi:histidinol-phosphate aminotransferase